MVGMFVRHEDIVGLGHHRIIHDSPAQLRARVNFYLLAVVLDTDTGMHQSVELDVFSTLGFENIYLVDISGHRHPSLFPGNDATLQVHTLIARGGQSTSSIGRTTTTSTIDGNRLVCRKNRLNLLYKVILSLVDIESSLNMPFGELRRSTHIQYHDTSILHQLCESLHISILKVLLTTSCCQP